MRKLRELALGEFLEQAENALAFGLPGVGKSNAACAIGNAQSSLDTWYFPTRFPVSAGARRRA